MKNKIIFFSRKDKNTDSIKEGKNKRRNKVRKKLNANMTLAKGEGEGRRGEKI